MHLTRYKSHRQIYSIWQITPGNHVKQRISKVHFHFLRSNFFTFSIIILNPWYWPPHTKRTLSAPIQLYTPLLSKETNINTTIAYSRNEHSSTSASVFLSRGTRHEALPAVRSGKETADCRSSWASVQMENSWVQGVRCDLHVGNSPYVENSNGCLERV